MSCVQNIGKKGQGLIISSYPANAEVQKYLKRLVIIYPIDNILNPLAMNFPLRHPLFFDCTPHEDGDFPKIF
jgi:hypothetical protein